jgi:hypothetical protein
MMIGLSVWAVREPAKKKKKVRKKSQSRDKPPLRRAAACDVTSSKLSTLGDPWDVITLAKFGLDRLDGFCSGGGQIYPSHASALARGNVVWAVLPSYGKG